MGWSSRTLLRQIGKIKDSGASAASSSESKSSYTVPVQESKAPEKESESKAPEKESESKAPEKESGFKAPEKEYV